MHTHIYIYIYIYICVLYCLVLSCLVLSCIVLYCIYIYITYVCIYIYIHLRTIYNLYDRCKDARFILHNDYSDYTQSGSSSWPWSQAAKAAQKDGSQRQRGQFAPKMDGSAATGIGERGKSRTDSIADSIVNHFGAHQVANCFRPRPSHSRWRKWVKFGITRFRDWTCSWEIVLNK